MLDTLPTELALLIFDQTLPESFRRDREWYIATDYRQPPFPHPLGVAIDWIGEANAASYYGTTTFMYISSVTGAHDRANMNAAQDLVHFLKSIKSNHRLFLRKLRLEMYGSELLMLFAPPEAASLLRLPQSWSVWTRVLELLKQLKLRELTIVVLAQTCPRPCQASERTVSGFGDVVAESDGSQPHHFHIDHRWIIKSVLESMADQPNNAIHFIQRQRPIFQDEVRIILGCSWNMLHSGTSSFHRCDTLSYEEDQRRFWAVVREQRAMYLIPALVVGGRGGEDEGWNMSKWQIGSLLGL